MLSEVQAKPVVNRFVCLFDLGKIINDSMIFSPIFFSKFIIELCY